MSQQRDGDSSFYHFDGTRNTAALSDAAGVVTDEYEHDAWGKLRSSTGSTPNAHTWKGEFLAYHGDPHAGPEESIYSLHHRDYVAQQGRLRSEDPAADDLNLYRYSGNDPINRADPSGLGDSLIVLQPGIEEQEAAEREAVVYAVGAAINAVRALKAGPDTLLTVQPDPAGHPSPSTAAALDASRAVSAAAWAEWYRLRNGGRAAGEQVVKTGNLAAEGDIGGAAGSLTAYAAGATSESLYGTLAVSSVTKLPPPLVQSHLSDVGERLDPESAELGRMAGP